MEKKSRTRIATPMIAQVRSFVLRPERFISTDFTRLLGPEMASLTLVVSSAIGERVSLLFFFSRKPTRRSNLAVLYTGSDLDD